MQRFFVGLALIAVVLLLAEHMPSSADAATDAEPSLTPSATALADSLTCSPDVAHATREPVLLVPGTTLTAKTNFDWNYEPALSSQGIPWCAVTPPGHMMGDIQTAAEYVVSAVRTMQRTSGHKVQVVGFSQGGMITRWALKFWPDTRDAVDDVIGIDPSNHGTVDANAVCAIGCAPAFWQQRSGSAFLKALNSGPETYAGISYTVVYSYDDEVVVPNLPVKASSELTTGAGARTNIAAQQICPVHVADHLTMGSIDPVAYAVVLDALTHAGPAEPTRIPRTACRQLLMPGVAPDRLATNEVRYAAEIATSLAAYPHVKKEPALAAYAQ